MPFDTYTLDQYTGGVRFRDSETGAEMLTTQEAGMQRMQDIDAARYAATGQLPQNVVPETTGVQYSTDVLAAPVAMPRPERVSLFDPARGALAQAGGGAAVVDLGDQPPIMSDVGPQMSVAPPKATAADVARLQALGAGVNKTLASGPAGSPVAMSGGAGGAPGGMSPRDAAILQGASDAGRTAYVDSGPPAPETAASGGAGGGGGGGAPPTAPTTAPAPAGPPAIVRTPDQGAQTAAPAQPPTMVTAQEQVSTQSSAINARSTQETVNRALGPSTQARTALYEAMEQQGVINAQQREALSRGEFDKAGLTFVQGQHLRDSAIQYGVRVANIESRTMRRQEASDQLARDVAEMRVDPNRIWKDASIGEKIQLGIAAMLGAIGSGMKGEQQNMGVKIIEDAVKRDVDLQMQDIAAKRELSTEFQRLVKLDIDQGASLQQARNQMSQMMLDSVIMRADSMAKKGGLYRAEDLDATGQPKPGTRSYQFAQAIADMKLRKAELAAKFSAEERGTVQRTLKNEAQTTVQKTVAQTNVPTVGAEGGDVYKGKPFYESITPEGKRVVRVIMNTDAVDPRKVVDETKVNALAFDRIGKIKELLKKTNVKVGLNQDERNLVAEDIAFLRSLALEQGVVKEEEAKRFFRNISGVIEGNDVVNAIEGLFQKKQSEIDRQSFSQEVPREIADKILASRPFKPEPRGHKLCLTRRSRPCASTTRAVHRSTRRPSTRSSCCGQSAATAWPRATPYLCACRASARCAWSRHARPCRRSCPGTTMRRLSRRTRSSSARPNTPASRRPSLALRRARRRCFSRAQATQPSSVRLA